MPRVSIASSQETYEVPANSILYNALEDQGLELPHGCLAGSCGACRIDVQKGSQNLSPAGAIESNTIQAIKDEYSKTRGEDFLKGKTIRLSCRAKVLGDVTFEPLTR